MHPLRRRWQKQALFVRNKTEDKKLLTNASPVIGPPPEVIDMMGNKITARGIAQECGIPIVPGATISLENAKEVKEFIQLCVLWSLSYDS